MQGPRVLFKKEYQLLFLNQRYLNLNYVIFQFIEIIRRNDQ